MYTYGPPCTSMLNEVCEVAATLRTASSCPVRLNLRRANGHVFSPASTKSKRVQMVPLLDDRKASQAIIAAFVAYQVLVGSW